MAKLHGKMMWVWLKADFRIQQNVLQISTISYSFYIFGFSSNPAELGWLSACAPRLSVKAHSHCPRDPTMGEVREAGGALRVLVAIWVRSTGKVSEAACGQASWWCGHLINSESWLLSSHPLATPQPCRSHQYSGGEWKRVGLLGRVPHGQGRQVLPIPSLSPRE